MGRAGGSAAEKYERLSARHRAGLPQRLIVNLSVAAVVAAAFWIYASAQRISLGPWVAAMIVFIGAAKAVVEPNHIRAWAIGAEGEAITARELAKLPAPHVALHDFRIPGTRSNVDHVVIGPGGVFVVETKRMQGRLRVRRGVVYIGGRRTGMVEEVMGEAQVVQTALDGHGYGHLRVQPLLYLQKVEVGWILPRPGGIPILMGRGLRRHIQRTSTVLDDATVLAVQRVLETSLRPMVRTVEDGPQRVSGAPVEAPVAAAAAPRPAPRVTSRPEDPVLAACPRCGNEMVLRRNRAGKLSWAVRNSQTAGARARVLRPMPRRRGQVPGRGVTERPPHVGILSSR